MPNATGVAGASGALMSAGVARRGAKPRSRGRPRHGGSFSAGSPPDPGRPQGVTAAGRPAQHPAVPITPCGPSAVTRTVPGRPRPDDAGRCAPPRNPKRPRPMAGHGRRPERPPQVVVGDPSRLTGILRRQVGYHRESLSNKPPPPRRTIARSAEPAAPPEAHPPDSVPQGHPD